MIKVNEKVVLEVLKLLTVCVGTYEAIKLATLNNEVKLAEFSKDITLAEINKNKEIDLAKVEADSKKLTTTESK